MSAIPLRGEPEIDRGIPVESQTSEQPYQLEGEAAPASGFSSFWEFAVALNHTDPAALALASNGASPEFPIDAAELKKLLGTFWFRSAFLRLSEEWRDRTLNVLVAGVAIPNHVIKPGRHAVSVSELTYEQLQEVCSKTVIRGQVGIDLQLLLTIAKLWGPEALHRLTFTEIDTPAETSKIGTVLQRLLS